MKPFTIIASLLIPKVIDTAVEYIEEAWDNLTAPSFSTSEIEKIKRCRKELDVTDEHLTYLLNEQLNQNLKVEDYRKIW